MSDNPMRTPLRTLCQDIRQAVRPTAVLVGLLLALVLLFSLPLAPSVSHSVQDEPPFPPAGRWFTYANGDDILTLELEGDVLWAGTRAGGVVRWDTSTGSYVQFLTPQDGLAGNIVYDIAIDPQGHKWFATDHGLSVLHDNGTPGKADDIWHTYTQQNTDGALPSDHITAVAVDEAGYLWIGSSQYWDGEAEAYVGGGVTQLDTRGTLDPTDDEWLPTHTLEETLTVDRGNVILGLASNNIADILPVPGNRVWVATRQHWLFEQPDENIPGQWVLAHGGISRLDHAGTPETDDDAWQTWNCEQDSLFACVVTQLRMDSLGYVWAAMRGRGVLAFRHDASTLRPDRDRLSTADGLESNFVDAIAFGPADDPEWANTVWFSTYRSFNGRGFGVSVLDHNGTPGNRRDDTWNLKNPVEGEPITTAHGLADDRVQAIVADGDVVWMGTGGISGIAFGISPYSLTKRAFETPLTTARDGIPSNYITDIAFGQAGSRWEHQVWLATGNRYERRYGVGALLLDTRGTLDPADDLWTQFTKEGTDDDGQPPWTGLAGNNIVALAVDGNDVWFGAREATWDSSSRQYTDGGLSVFDGQHWTVRTVENTGGDLVGTSTELSTGTSTELSTGTSTELSTGTSTGLGTGTSTGLDTGTSSGLSTGTSTILSFVTERSQETGLHSNSISALAVGCRGELWIGLGSLQDSIGYGIDILDTGDAPHDLGSDTWPATFRYPDIPSDLVTDMAPDCARGDVWVSNVPYFTGSRSQGGGVGRYDLATEQWVTYTTAEGIESFASGEVTGEVHSITLGPDGTVWVGTWGTSTTSSGDLVNQWPYVPAVVNWYSGGSWSNMVFAGNGWISSLAVDPTGIVWAGTSHGGMDMDRDGHAEDLEIRKAIGGLKLTRDGSGWADSSAFNSRLPADDIEVIAVAPDGDVWVGTSGWGVMRFHPGEEPATPTPTSSGTSMPTSTSPPTPTSTNTPTPPGPTSTPEPTTTPSSTASPVPATPTSTPAGPFPRQVYLSLIARNRVTRLTPSTTATPNAPTTTPTSSASPVPTLPTATATEPPPDTSPRFTCGGWCELGSSPGMRRQRVTSDRPVDDWRMYINGLPFGLLEEEDPMYAIVEAPEGYHVRIEALFGGEWYVACESDVECPESR